MTTRPQATMSPESSPRRRRHTGSKSRSDSSPLKTERALPPLGVGAGAGKRSPAPKFVGWKMPRTSGPESGSGEPAASFSPIVRCIASMLPPTSDITIAF